MTMKTLGAALIAAAVALPGAASAAGAGGEVTDIDFSFEGPFGTYDRFQLQRGFQIYQNVCAGCHGMKFVPFGSLGDAGGPEFPEEQVRAIAAQYTVIDKVTGEERPGRPSDNFPANEAVGAPDMSLIAKARAGFHGPYGTGISQLFNGIGGAEYIYSLLTGYNDKDEEVAGTYLYGNDIYPGGLINMAPPLYGDDVEYGVYGEGNGYTPPEASIEQEAEDVAAFLMWAAEPKLNERKEAGLRNFIMLAVLAVLLYYTNKQIWASVKGKD